MKEEKRDRLVNPQKWKSEDIARLADKQAVEKRRRDRYLQYFVAKEEQERMLQAASSGAAGRASVLALDETQPPAGAAEAGA